MGRWVQMVRVQHGREHSSRLQAANSRPGSRSQKLELASTTASMKLRKKKKNISSAMLFISKPFLVTGFLQPGCTSKASQTAPPTLQRFEDMSNGGGIIQITLHIE